MLSDYLERFEWTEGQTMEWRNANFTEELRLLVNRFFELERLAQILTDNDAQRNDFIDFQNQYLMPFHEGNNRLSGKIGLQIISFERAMLEHNARVNRTRELINNLEIMLGLSSFTWTVYQTCEWNDFFRIEITPLVNRIAELERLAPGILWNQEGIFWFPSTPGINPEWDEYVHFRSAYIETFRQQVSGLEIMADLNYIAFENAMEEVFQLAELGRDLVIRFELILGLSHIMWGRPDNITPPFVCPTPSPTTPDRPLFPSTPNIPEIPSVPEVPLIPQMPAIDANSITTMFNFFAANSTENPLLISSAEKTLESIVDAITVSLNALEGLQNDVIISLLTTPDTALTQNYVSNVSVKLQINPIYVFENQKIYFTLVVDDFVNVADDVEETALDTQPVNLPQTGSVLVSTAFSGITMFALGGCNIIIKNRRQRDE